MTNQKTVQDWINNLDTGYKLDGHNSTKSIFWHGDKLYSYGYHFPLAWYQGGRSVVINVSKYSTTTSHHQSMLKAELEDHCIDEFHEVKTKEFLELLGR